MGLGMICGGAMVVAGCAGSPTADNTQPVDRACTVDDCFYEREVRDFEVINQTTLIVYVGNQRCPFQVELRGTFCDLEFAPELYFHPAGEIHKDSDRPVAIGGGGTLSPIGPSSPESQLADAKVCSNDITTTVSGGVFTDNPTSNQPVDRYGNQRNDCEVSSVTSLTDDELIELYVSRGVVPPPPPMGSGQIKVGDQQEQGGSGTAPSGEAPPESTDAGASAEVEATAATQ